MLIPRPKIKEMLVSADWETVFADTNKNYIELYDEIYTPYVREHCFTDADIAACAPDQEAWALKHYMLPFADILALYLLEYELLPILGSDYEHKIRDAASSIAEDTNPLPAENIKELISVWCNEQELTESTLLHLYSLLEESGGSATAKDKAEAAADQLVHWHVYRTVLSKLQNNTKVMAEEGPPIRRQGESLDEYKARLNLYINSLDDAICDTTPNSDMASDPF